MRITQIDSYQLKLPLVQPFRTSYGCLKEKAMDIIVITDEEGNTGYGELVAFEQPDYTEETLETARYIIQQYLVPLLISCDLDHPSQVSNLFSKIRGNWMAKSALETAIWDLFAKKNQRSLQSYLKIEPKSLIEVGVSIGIQEDPKKLVNIVSEYVELGYKRVKLKIEPGYDLIPLSKVREAFPTLKIMVDANSAYTLKHLDLLKQLDQFNLSMIEQPFGYSDFLEHSHLQRNIETPVCLDENIRGVGDVQLAYELGSARAINLKVSRVGGITEALKIIEYCKDKEMILWCGGMFESGVGRALNCILASHSAFNFPGDISASERYFFRDIINEPFFVNNGLMNVPQKPGIGVTLNRLIMSELGQHQNLYIKKI